MIGRAHQRAVALRDKAADSVHVPDMILVRVHCAFGGHHVERGDAGQASTSAPASSLRPLI